MDRNSYSVAIVLGIFVSLFLLFDAVMFLGAGVKYLLLDSYLTWFGCSSALLLTWLATLANHLHRKKYKFAFLATVARAISLLLLSGLMFVILFGAPVTILSMALLVTWILSTAIVGVSLIVRPAGNKKWLKVAGVLTVIAAVVDLLAIASQQSWLDQSTRFVNAITPLFFVLHFNNEMKSVGEQKNSSPNQLDTILGISSMIIMLLTFAHAPTIAAQTYRQVNYERDLIIKGNKYDKAFRNLSRINKNGDTLSYKLINPINFDSSKVYPLVVGLPFSRSIEGCPPAEELLKEHNRMKYPAFLLVPFCPDGSSWGGVKNTPAIDTIVFETIEFHLIENKSIDSKRVYVAGVSKGGYGSWHFITNRPDLFAAAIPICGEGNPQLASKLVDVDVWAFHGARDRNVPVSGSRNMIKAMRDAGLHPDYTEYRNKAHNIWDDVAAEPGVLDWLFSQKKD